VEALQTMVTSIALHSDAGHGGIIRGYFLEKFICGGWEISSRGSFARRLKQPWDAIRNICHFE
jgi:hypothetical protein